MTALIRCSRQARIASLVVAFLLLALPGTAVSQTVQGIFTGTVRLDSAIPSAALDTPIVQLLRGDQSYVRTAIYNPQRGTYGVNAFNTDSLAQGDTVLFRILYNNDTLMTRTSGDAARFYGTAHPAPPDGQSLRDVNLFNNHAPLFTVSTTLETASEDFPYSEQMTATDAENDRLTYRLLQAPAWLTIDPSTGELSGTPAAADVGTDTLMVEVNDGYFRGTTTGAFILTIVHTNHRPYANNVTYELNEDIRHSFILPGGDTDDDPLTYTIVTFPLSGTVEGNGRERTYMPAKNFNGTDRLTFAISDGALTSDTATVTFTVLPVNDAPGAFRLLSPKNRDTLLLHTSYPQISFSWEPALDVDAKDLIRYAVRIAGPGLDTLFSGFTETRVGLDIMRLLEVSSAYTWSVTASDSMATTSAMESFLFITSSTVSATGNEQPDLPTAFALDQNFPNPFNPTTHLQFSICNLQLVTLKVYTILGDEVAELVGKELTPGSYTIPWDAGNLPSGVYYYRLVAGSFTETRRMLLVK